MRNYNWFTTEKKCLEAKVSRRRFVLTKTNRREQATFKTRCLKRLRLLQKTFFLRCKQGIYFHDYRFWASN